jgi:hypothetical protein
VRQLFRSLRRSLHLASASLSASDAAVLLTNSMSAALNTLVGRRDDGVAGAGSRGRLTLAALRRWAELGVERGAEAVVAAETAAVAAACGIEQRTAALSEAIAERCVVDAFFYSIII